MWAAAVIMVIGGVVYWVTDLFLTPSFPDDPRKARFWAHIVGGTVSLLLFIAYVRGMG